MISDTTICRRCRCRCWRRCRPLELVPGGNLEGPVMRRTFPVSRSCSFLSTVCACAGRIQLFGFSEQLTSSRARVCGENTRRLFDCARRRAHQCYFKACQLGGWFKFYSYCHCYVCRSVAGGARIFAAVWTEASPAAIGSR